MSHPKRYEIDSDGVPYPLDTGDYVRHSDYAALSAEVDRLRSASFVTAVPSEEYERLKAEVERLRESQLSKDKWISCEQMHFQTADNLRDKLYQACLKIERLERAGDTVVAAYCMGDWDTEKWKDYPVVAQWIAAKEGRGAK